MPRSAANAERLTPYVNGLKEKILSALGCAKDEKPFSGLKIVVDAGNGAGGFFAERLLEPLGADITGSRFLEPDGRFPNHQPNPENAEAMRSICDAVTETGADFGIIFDTDVDRAGAVLPSDGGVIALDRNRLIALMTAILVRQYGPITVVTDSITSTGLTDFINSLGCRHHRFKRGYRNVINEAKRLLALEEAAKNAIFANAIFAMETSGHGALRENYFLDDGAYLCTKIIIKAAQMRKEGKELDELTASLKEPLESTEIRYKILEKDFRACGEKIIADLTKYAEEQDGWCVADDNREGIRVSFDRDNGDGWFLLRLSVHDPIMPLNVESDSEGGVKIICDKLGKFLKTTTGLDL